MLADLAGYFKLQTSAYVYYDCHVTCLYECPRWHLTYFFGEASTRVTVIWAEASCSDPDGRDASVLTSDLSSCSRDDTKSKDTLAVLVAAVVVGECPSD